MTARLLVPELVRMPGGSFVMGKEGSRADEGPAHPVTVPPFRAALRPVSNAEYAVFVAATAHESAPFLDDDRFNKPDQPAVGISWFDALDYCRWLSATSGVPFRLPTEAQREFAALGGLHEVDWPWSAVPVAAGFNPQGERSPEVEGYNLRESRRHAPGASSSSNRAPQHDGIPHPAYARLAALDCPHVPLPECANGYGLLCMADNVHEWCSDWYDASYYRRSPEDSPRGPESGTRRASRGGSWRHQVKFTRLNARSSLNPSYRYNDYGFRVYADI